VEFLHGYSGVLLGGRKLAAEVGRTRRRRVDGENTAGKPLAIKALHGGLKVRSILEFHETESAGMSRHAITYHLRERNGMALFLEPLT
jgi:hypothetical protein